MAAQAGAIRIAGRTPAIAHDLGDVPAAVHVQAPGPVTVLALDPLLGVKRVAIVAVELGVTRRTCLRTNSSRARNAHVLGETADSPRSVFFLG
jgi:hypothetical protein